MAISNGIFRKSVTSNLLNAAEFIEAKHCYQRSNCTFLRFEEQLSHESERTQILTNGLAVSPRLLST